MTSTPSVISFPPRVSKGELHLSRKLDVNVLEIDPKYYTALRSFYQGVKTADEQQIVLTAGASTAGN